MQKIGLLSFSLLIFLFSFNTSFAQSNVAEVKSDLAASDSAQKSNYELPYHGLLPDSPIYFFRIIRDRIISFLISDPLKKAEFNLLQADKRLNAGIYLFNSAKQNEKKIGLAISTISKAENYFHQALEKTKEAQKEGMEIQEMTRKLINSAKKHQEELDSLEKKSPQDFKTSFNSLRKRVSVFEIEANSLGLKI